VTLCAVVLTLAYPLREYLGQRGEIADLQGAARASAERVVRLEQMQRRYTDPEFVAAEARRRLQLVRPGESVLLEVPKPTPPAPRSGRGRLPAAAPAAGDNAPWYVRLWHSGLAAGAAPAR
jgi:hypothetical protein